MEYLWKINTDHRRSCRFKDWQFAVSLTMFLVFCICIIYVCNSTAETLPESTCLLTLKADNNFIKNSKRNEILMMKNWARRLLLGSSPPRCNSKCGKCTPCKPVHVAVPPGTPVTTEYYPEAWRCKCGNKLYMP